MSLTLISLPSSLLPQRNAVFHCPQRMIGRYLTVQKFAADVWEVDEIFVQEERTVKAKGMLEGEKVEHAPA